MPLAEILGEARHRGEGVFIAAAMAARINEQQGETRFMQRTRQWQQGLGVAAPAVDQNHRRPPPFHALPALPVRGDEPAEQGLAVFGGNRDVLMPQADIGRRPDLDHPLRNRPRSSAPAPIGG
jgi:hypothetical protein